MKKKFILISLILLLVVGTFYLISIAPYHIYTLTLTEGVNTQFLKMNPTKPFYYNGSKLEYSDEDELLKNSKSIISQIHFSNFDLTLPLKYPSYSLIPSIKIKSTQVRLGADFIDHKFKEQFTFTIEKEMKFETNLVNQELYLLPIFRNYISKKSHEEEWEDIFLKKLSLPSNEGKGFFESLKILNQLSYQELVYNLFILNNRVNILPEEFLKIQYDADSKIGLILISDDNTATVERLYLLNQGIIYPITIVTNPHSAVARFARNKFIQEIKYKSSNKDQAIPIYAEYKNLKYKEQIEEKGMRLLYTAWSHDIDNKEFIRVIINFLERGTSNIKYLRPFYEYAYRRFGSSFSTDHDFLVETPEEKMKRLSTEELQKEISNEDKIKGLAPETDASKKDEKVKIFLQKAKEKKLNSDDNLNELKIE